MIDKNRINYLITGGAGFIGANFVKFLLNKYADHINIVVLDALTYAGNLMSISDDIKRDNVNFVNGDINDKSIVDKIFADFNPDFVVNFAAESHVDRSISNPRIFLETNILGTQSLLDAARHAWQLSDGSWLNNKKFLQISTDEVYGSLTRDFDTPKPLQLSNHAASVTAERKDKPAAYGNNFFFEDTPLAPRSPYSSAKAGADMLVMAYAHTYGMPVNITRCSNNYGPFQFPEKLIPLLINNILEGRDLPVYGKGLNVRDWLYVDDHCSAIDLVLRKGKLGEVYNIGGFNEKQNIDIVHEVIDIVAELTNTAPRLNLIKYVKDRAGHDMRYAICPDKIATDLGWFPVTPFSEGIRKTIAWYLDNRDWTRSVTSGQYREYYKRMYENR
jgi:dTDP-glucose 4,6-dehydratase